MEEGALLGGMSSPEEAMVPDLFGADGGFVSENMPLKVAAVVRAEEEEFHVLKDPYLSAADPKGPLLHAFNPPLSVDCKGKAQAELLVEDNDEEMLGEFPRLPELDPLEDAVLPAAPPPQAYSVHFLSPVRTAHGSPAVVPLGAWAREGAAHTSVRVIPVEVKEGGGASEIPEEAALQNPLSQEAHAFRSSQEVEGASGVSHQDTSPVVLCQLRGAAPVLCADGAGAAGLQALHWAPRGQDPSDSPRSDGPRPVTALVGRLLPVPAKLNLITQQARVTGSAVCKGIGCSSHQESPARTAALAAAPACAETGGAEGGPPRPGAERRSSCISWEVVEATCACLLAQGEEAERARRPEGLAQQMILEEFGRCLSQILHTEFKSKGLTVE